MQKGLLKLANGWLLPLLIGMFASLPASAQQETSDVSGIVRNEAGQPLANVSVIARNSKTDFTEGAQTDSAGIFRFVKLPVNGRYNFAFTIVGYDEQKLSGYALKANESTSITIRLKETYNSLGEVVVVGYGSQTRAKATGAISQIRSDSYKDQPIGSFEQGIAGQVPGVQVLQDNGAPGSGITVRVRGVGSITAGNQPLYVIDGFPVDDPNTNLLNPNDIETIDVLKDAAAAAIYGSRGSNGVIIITTKKGSTDKPKFEFNTYFGNQSVTKELSLMSAYQFANFAAQARNNSWIAANPSIHSASDPNSSRPIVDQIPTFLQPYLGGEKGLTNTNWQNAIFRDAHMQNYSLSVAGGKGNTKYYVSGNFLDQDGIIIHSDFKRYALRANVESKLSDKVTFGLNLAPSYSQSDLVSQGQHGNDGAVITSLIEWPTVPIYNPDGSFALGVQENEAVGYSMAAIENPVAVTSLISDKLNSTRILGTAYVDIQIAKGLKFKSLGGEDYFSSNENYFRPSVLGAYRTPPPTVAQGKATNINVLNWLTENTLTYNTSIRRNNITALAGYTTQKESRDSMLLVGQGFPNNNVQTLSAATQIVGPGTQSYTSRNDFSLISWLGRILYDYDAKYLLSASIRRDGSSRFGPNNRWGWFPSASAGWRISKEDFFPTDAAVSDWKIRASYGETGNFQIPNYGSYSLLANTNYVLGGNFVNGQSPSTPANPNLSWEKTAQVNIGTDIGFIKNKLYATIDYYTSKTQGLLLNVPLPYASGFSSELRNAGSVSNKGIDVGISSKINLGPVEWSATFNISTDKNKVLSLGPGQSQIIINRNVTEIGHPIGSYFGYKILGVFKDAADLASYPHLSTSIPGTYKYQDVNGDGQITTADRTILGSPFPKYIAGFTSDFKYKHFDLGFVIQAVQGFQVDDLTKVVYLINGEGWGNASEAEYTGHYTSPSSPGTGYAINLSSPTDSYHQTSSYMIENGSFIRLRNLTLGYTLPAAATKKMTFQSLRFYVSGQNLYTITKYSGYNPEVSQNGSDALEPGIDYGAYPAAKTIIIGLNLNF